LRKLPSLSQPISKGSHYHTPWILLRPLAKPVHFTIRKSAKVRNAWKSTKCFKSSLQPSNRLDFSFQNVYNKGTKFSVVLAISHLVVRRTFYLIVNDRDLALKIRLLFSIAIQLIVVIYIIQPIVVIVNGFLLKFKKNFLRLYMEFAERLKTLRKQEKLTQVQIAEKLEISQQAYAAWERGNKKPTQENLVKIAQVLNVSVDYLVGNSEEKIDELDNIELLFRMNSKGLTEEEKEIFKKELIEFMEERRELFKGD